MREFYEGARIYSGQTDLRVPMDYILLEKGADLKIALAIVHGLNLGVDEGIFKSSLAGNESDSTAGLKRRMPLDMRLYRYANQHRGRHDDALKGTIIYAAEAPLALRALDLSIASGSGPTNGINAVRLDDATNTISNFIAMVERSS